ncbi:MAG: HEAT repeat domain-containing protein [Desulfuromonadales bacterium]|nr:HEAT repeat domain-containing protein [Desulfuromonadales bacterium]
MTRYTLLFVIMFILNACEQQGPLDLAALEGRARSGDQQATEQLVTLLGHTENNLNMQAYKILLDLGKKAAPALIKEIDSDSSERREHVIAALGTLQVRAAVPEISAVLANTKSGRRYIAAWALGEIADPAGIPALIAALDDPDHQVRRYATRSLIKLNRAAVPPLLDVLSAGSVRAVAGAIRALGDIGDQRALDALLQQLSGEHRSEAILALGKLKDRRAAAAMISALDDPDWRIRMNAAMALGPLGGPAAVESLRKTLEDEVRVVREWSARSLEMITGEHVLYRNNAGDYVPPYNIYH